MLVYRQEKSNEKIIVIAEAGVNHNGDIELAKKLIDAASEAGADYVKFQSFKSELAVSKHAQKAQYQKTTNDNKNTSQLEMVKNLELSEEQQSEIINYCKKKSIKFLSSPFDLVSIDFLFKMGIEIFKIPSGEITNFPYLKHIAQKRRPVIMSTGMSTLGEVENAIEILMINGLNRSHITLLHCNTEYPTPAEDVNLRAMLTLQNAFNTKVGYSDHTLGIEISVAAAALGAQVIEKHFTLSRELEGPDHKASLEPLELSELVRSIRNVENALGNGIKRVTDSEKNNPLIKPFAF